MKKFIVIYHAPVSWLEPKPDVSAEDMKKSEAAWMAWAEACGEGLVDMGSPLGSALKFSSSGTVPGDASVTGYSVLQAKDLESAKSMLEDHPHLSWGEGSEIELYETFSME